MLRIDGIDDDIEEIPQCGERKQEGKEHGEYRKEETSVGDGGRESECQRQCQRVAPDTIGEGPGRESVELSLHQQERQQAGAEEVGSAPERGDL